MQTFPDCLPCLLCQAENTIKHATRDPMQRRSILDAVAALLARCDHTLSPPENAATMYRLIADRSGVADPYAAIKAQSNKLARSLLPLAREKITTAADPLFAAIQYAMAGNVIDYGTQHELDVEKTLVSCPKQTPAICDYQQFRHDLAASRTVLYLADNCGELVFDGLLIEQLDREVTLATKAGPIINDALPTDASACGLDHLCRVITNGTACPDTPLTAVNDEFRRLFDRADLVISKGQGNFETLSECDRPLYFLLTVKCQVVADYLTDKNGCRPSLGAPVLLRHPSVCDPTAAPAPASPPSANSFNFS